MYSDDKYFIIWTTKTPTENNILKYYSNYYLFKHDGTLVETATDVINADDLKGSAVTKMPNQEKILLSKVFVNSDNKIALQFSKSDGNGAFQSLKTMIVENENLDIAVVRNIIPTSEGNLLMGFSYLHKGNLKLKGGSAEKWANFTLFSGKELGLTTTIKEQDEIQKLSIFPNPASEKIEIISENGFDEIKIFDIMGKMQINHLSINKTIDISNLNSGIYFIEVYKTNKKIATTSKFIKM